MAGPAALVGDHPTGLFEDGFPIGVRAPGHQHIPLLKALDFRRIADHPRVAMAYRGANRTAADQGRHLVGIQPPRLQHGLAALGLHRFRPGLKDEQLAADAILGPFQVHRRLDAPLGAVVPLHQHRPPGELEGLLVTERIPLLFGQRHRLIAHRMARPGLRAA